MKIKYADKYRLNEVIDLRIDYFKENYKKFTEEQETKLRNNLKDYFSFHLGKDCFPVLAVVDNKAVASAILSVYSKAPNRRSVYLNCGFVEIESRYTTMKYYFDDALKNERTDVMND